MAAIGVAYAALWSAAAIAPVDRKDWWLENLLVFGVVGALAGTYRGFRFSTAAYVCVALFLSLHAVGAHYSYEHVPTGLWARDAFGLGRNHFDRLVHLAFGVLAVPVARELVARTSRLEGFWLHVLPAAFVFALASAFELFEATAARSVSPALADAYLGMQGDAWDAQKDMALALAGAAASSVRLSRSRRAGQTDRDTDSSRLRTSREDSEARNDSAAA